MSPTVVVTGAGSGIGRCLSVYEAIRGARVTLAGRRKDRLLETREAALAAGAEPEAVLVLPLDLREDGAPEYVIAQTLRTFAGVDAVVNNAGVARFAPLESLADDDVAAMWQTDLVAPLALTRAALPALRRTRGVVVNVGSIGGVLALPGRSAYGATKAALHSLTRSLARELAPDVRVNAILPGAVDTEMYDRLGLPDDAVTQLRAQMVATTPLGRMGTPEDVVPWIDLMIGPAGRWMTGSLVVLDGGRSC